MSEYIERCAHFFCENVTNIQRMLQSCYKFAKSLIILGGGDIMKENYGSISIYQNKVRLKKEVYL